MSAEPVLTGWVPQDVGLFGWLVFLALAIPLNNRSIRQTYISAKLLKFYKKVIFSLGRRLRSEASAQF